MLALSMRRISLAASLCLALVMAGCSASERPPVSDSPSAGSRPLVLTTFTVLADIARNVAGDHLRVQSLTKVGAEIHGYEPTPADLTVAADADLILDNGLGLERWFERFVADLDVPHVVVSDGIEPIPIGEGQAVGHANPHAWMSPTNAIIYVHNIADAFVRLDPTNTAAYRANAESYADDIRGIGETLAAALAELPTGQRALVTCEGAFSYVARDEGLTEQYLWPVNAESEATPQSVAAAIDFVRDNDVSAVFCESTVSARTMEQVADEAQARFGGVLYVDSLSTPEGPVPTYMKLIEYNVGVIVAGLTRGDDGG
nr:metal ABC transporter substrate-binding protein [Klugiella xanthotipulae]